MSVHVDELHTDVVPAPSPGGPADGERAVPPWTREERWADARRRAEESARRVAAEGFDD